MSMTNISIYNANAGGVARYLLVSRIMENNQQKWANAIKLF